MEFFEVGYRVFIQIDPVCQKRSVNLLSFQYRLLFLNNNSRNNNLKQS